ncbi:MAG: DUF5683 domain-containing protein [Alistipes sp.]|jgi:hypothetical protein|nr:DUF5683 domain-containing protein [Alistipes sp.]
MRAKEIVNGRRVVPKAARLCVAFIALSLFAFHFSLAWAQNVRPNPGERIAVRGGVAATSVRNAAGIDLSEMTPDSLYKFMSAIDSLRGDGVLFDRARTDSLITLLIDRTSPTGDSLDEQQVAELVAERKAMPINPATVRQFLEDRRFTSRYIDGGADTLVGKFAVPDTLSRRERRQLARLDTTRYRYNDIFRDSIKLSPMVAISMALPGFSQFYNEDYWKIPVVYGTMAAGIGLWAWQNNKYKPYKKLYDYYVDRPVKDTEPGYGRYKSTMTELQGNMMRHNTYRSIAMGAAVASYVYSLVDGTLNYSGAVDHVKKATTLATVCPGAGQVYNKNYWKLPVVMGGAATLIYCIDWNNRGYQRYLRAYNARTDDSDETVVDEALVYMTDSQLANQKNSFRRNRDLCIILTGLFYIIQMVDAHATAHMQTYDISDDLARTNVTFEPAMDNFYSHGMGQNVSTFGFSLGVRF